MRAPNRRAACASSSMARDLTAQNVLAAGPGGEKGAGGTGTPRGFAGRPASTAPAPPLEPPDPRPRDPTRPAATSFAPARATARRSSRLCRWMPGDPPRAGARPARNIIMLLGDGMGAGVRTAARVASKGQHFGKAAAPLAMDTMPVTGLVGHLVTERHRHRLGPRHVGPTPPGTRATTTRKASTPTTPPTPSTTRASSTSASCCGGRAAQGFNVGIVTAAQSDRRHARSQRRPHRQPRRPLRHRHALLRRARLQRRQRAAGRRLVGLLPRGGGRPAA